MKTILMTGAAGRIGTFLRPELAGKYKLRLSDIKPIRDLRPGETFVRADISKLSDMLRVTKGVDAVVHFGGQSGEHDWEHILSANIIGFYNALEAARRNGVKRFLVATSNHAVGFYRCDETIDHTRLSEARQPLRRVEGLQRGARESLRRPLRHGDVLHAHRQRESASRSTGAGSRSGSAGATWRSSSRSASSSRDLRFEIVYGISDNERAWFDNRNARRLGYRPQDRSEPYAKEILKREGPPGNLAGGHLPGRRPLHVRRRNAQPAGRGDGASEDEALHVHLESGRAITRSAKEVTPEGKVEGGGASFAVMSLAVMENTSHGHESLLETSHESRVASYILERHT